MRFYKFCLYKAYFNYGMGLTYYVRWIIAFFGLASQDVNTTMWIAGVYAVFSFILGWSWFKFGLVNAEHEVNNQFNPFVKEMRKSVNRKT